MVAAAKTGLAGFVVGGLVVAGVSLAAAPALADCPGRAPVGVTGASRAAPQGAPGNCTTAYDGGMVTLSGQVMGTVTDTYTMTRYQYDYHGEILAQTTSDGITTYFGHDGPVTEVTDPLGHTTRFTYDATHDLTQVTDTAGGRVTYGYDAQNRVTGITDAMGRPSTYGYDAGSGLMDTTTDGMGATTTYQYDGLNRITGSTMGGVTTSYVYDPGDGALTGTSDTLGRTTSYQYDALNRMTGETDVFGGSTETTTYTYDALGDVLSQTDPMGRVTTYTYDALGEMLSQTNPDGSTIYDSWSNGLLQSQTDPLGHTTTYSYDPLHRLIGESGPDGASSFAPGIPEPASWVLMMIGFGALGLRMRGAGATRRRLFT